MRSIRSYLMARLLGGTALVLAVACVAIYGLVERSLEAQFDRSLQDRVQGFASVLFQAGDELEFEFSEELMPEYSSSVAPAYFELWREDGELLERSESLGAGKLAVPGTPGTLPTHWTAPLADGRPGRFVAQVLEVHHVYPEEGPDRPQAAKVLVVIARGTEELMAAERALLRQCILIALILMALIAALSWTAVERGLAPARRLAAELDAIDVQALPACFEVGALPSELVPVAEKSDALIRRVDAALKHERRTAADIAHELRTPISEILTVSEVALRGGGGAGEERRALGIVRDVAWRMAGAVSTLLALARLEMGASAVERGDVELGRIVRECLRTLAAKARERELQVENHVAEDERVLGDPEVLRIVLSNLLGNAVHYSPLRGLVSIRATHAPGGWSCGVENQVRDLRPEDLPSMTEPFWRKDRSRTSRHHTGLGLTLSHALAREMGMELDFELEGSMLRASLRSAGEDSKRAGVESPDAEATRAREPDRARDPARDLNVPSGRAPSTAPRGPARTPRGAPP